MATTFGNSSPSALSEAVTWNEYSLTFESMSIRMHCHRDCVLLSSDYWKKSDMIGRS